MLDMLNKSKRNKYTGVRIGFHILRDITAGALNLDINGRPKVLELGGERARISSQSLKRSVREYFYELGQDKSYRTRMLSDVVLSMVLDANKSLIEDDVKPIVKHICSYIGSNVMLHLSLEEFKVIALFIETDILPLMSEAKPKKAKKTNLKSNEESQQEENDLLSKVKKEDGVLKKKLHSLLLNSVKNLTVDSGYIDIALFGRTVANAKDLYVDGSVSFSHAYTTSLTQIQYDNIAAKEELSGDNSAGHLNTLMFVSGVFYQFVQVNLGELYDNLGQNDEVMNVAISRFVESLYYAVPGGKKNSFNSTQKWNYARICVMEGRNSYLNPVSFREPVSNKSAMKESIASLNKQIDNHFVVEGSDGLLLDRVFDLENPSPIKDVFNSITKACKK